MGNNPQQNASGQKNYVKQEAKGAIQFPADTTGQDGLINR